MVILDTPGLDDEGHLGNLRIEKAKQTLAQTNIAVLVVDARTGLQDMDRQLIGELQARRIPCITALNKADLLADRPSPEGGTLYVSAVTGEGITNLKERLGQLAQQQEKPNALIRDLLSPGDLVVLVTPIDEAAPKGRLILPQQMVLRDVLDAHAMAIVCQTAELKDTLAALGRKPRMVITDSQAFAEVNRDTPADIPLTSFSILMARYKGELDALTDGYFALEKLQDGDHVLISEGCTHHRQCNDIGTVKMPGWIEKISQAKPVYHFTSGGDFPQDLSPYRVIVHCGGCMLNQAEMQHRVKMATDAGVPIVNYGIAIAGMHGILKRSLALFSH